MKDRTLGDGIARQELNLLFVIDNSGSMEGEKIGATPSPAIILTFPLVSLISTAFSSASFIPQSDGLFLFTTTFPTAVR